MCLSITVLLRHIKLIRGGMSNGDTGGRRDISAGQVMFVNQIPNHGVYYWVLQESFGCSGAKEFE